MYRKRTPEFSHTAKAKGAEWSSTLSICIVGSARRQVGDFRTVWEGSDLGRARYANLPSQTG